MAWRNSIPRGESARFRVIDSDTAEHALGNTLELARRYSLSAYDAACRELALREGVALASLVCRLTECGRESGYREVVGARLVERVLGALAQFSGSSNMVDGGV